MDPFELTPEEQQRVMAETLRSQAVLGEAQRRGSRFDNLAAIAPLVNNKAINETAKAAQARAVSASKPVQLGNTGFMVGDQFAANPGFLQENLEKRAQARGLAAERARTAAELQQQRLAQAAQLQQERLAAQAFQAEQNRALRGTLAAIAAGNKTSAADAKAAEKAEKDANDYAFKLSNNLEKAGASEFGSALEIVQETLGKYKDGTLPGFGRFASLIPSQMSSEEVQKVRSNMQQAANILLKSRSGAAVTNSEMNRFLTEVASGAGMSEAALRNGWANVERTYGADLNNIMSGVPPEAIDVYKKRGGRDYREIINKPKAATGDKPPQGIDPALWKQMTPEERALWN